MISSKFFKPDDELIKSLVEYFNGRMVLEIGSGSCYVIEKLFKAGQLRIAGIEPYPGKRMLKNEGNIVNIMPARIQDVPALLTKNKGVILICRPSHSGFVQYCIENKSNESELIYIGLKKNFDIDGISDVEYTELFLNGSSEDDEVIISIK